MSRIKYNPDEYLQVEGLLKLDAFSPFNYRIMMIDYDNMIEQALYNNGVVYWNYKPLMVYTTEPKYQIKFIKVPKLGYALDYFVFYVYHTQDKIRKIVGEGYSEMYNRVMELLNSAK